MFYLYKDKFMWLHSNICQGLMLISIESQIETIYKHMVVFRVWFVDIIQSSRLHMEFTSTSVLTLYLFINVHVFSLHSVFAYLSPRQPRASVYSSFRWYWWRQCRKRNIWSHHEQRCDWVRVPDRGGKSLGQRRPTSCHKEDL